MRAPRAGRIVRGTRPTAGLVPACVAGAALLASCSAVPTEHVDAQVIADTSIDAAEVRPADAAQPFDAGTDGAAVPDATAPCVCEPASDCESAACVDGACVRTAVSDGLTCGSDAEICVAGACAPRGCGDGYREPGPKPAREGCDDGNTADGDTCSSSCTPTPFVVAARMNRRDAPVGPAASIGIDGAGRALVIWRADMTSGLELHAARFSPAGVPLDRDPPITIASGYEPLHASVAGLRAGGWVVAWSAPNGDGDMAGVLVRTVGVDGRLGTVRVAPEETFLDQTVPSITPFEDGFALAWNDQSLLLGTGPAPRARARLFDAGASPTTAEFSLAADATVENQDPVIAAAGSTLVAAWIDRSGTTPAIHARRFDSRGRALDVSDIVVAPSRASDAAIAALASGDVAIAWRDGNVDPGGDIWGATLSSADGSVSVPFALYSSPSPYGFRTNDLAPSVARLGSGLAVVHQRWLNGRGIGTSTRDVDPAPPELDLLTAHLAEETAGDAAIAWGPRGLWAVWSTGTDPSGVGAYRSVMAFLMAED